MNSTGDRIKVGFCVSYDWKLLTKSLPLIYPYADSICLSVDINRRSWSGEPYIFDESAFRAFVSAIDLDGKITVYEDNFYDPALSAIDNDSRQRRLMSEFMGAGGWHIQIDSDEYFLDFPGFVEYLKTLDRSRLKSSKPVNICCRLVSVFKKLDSGYLVMDNSQGKWETSPLATRHPEYLYARVNSHFNIVSPYIVLHETWSRSREELVQKLDSWGHINDFHRESYLKLWDAIDDNNYHFVKDFHPIQRGVWMRLAFFKASSMSELMKNVSESNLIKSNKLHLRFRNSRWRNRLLSIFKLSH